MVISLHNLFFDHVSVGSHLVTKIVDIVMDFTIASINKENTVGEIEWKHYNSFYLVSNQS